MSKSGKAKFNEHTLILSNIAETLGVQMHSTKNLEEELLKANDLTYLLQVMRLNWKEIALFIR